MHAVVVEEFGKSPVWREFPEPAGATEVVAAGLHPRVRSGAKGTHYSSTGVLPMVPGIDGVARRDDGTLVFFVADDEVMGSMAERTAVDPRRSVELPAGTDPVAVAAAMNPAMSSWVALRRRVPLQPGQTVLVLGATGNAGAMACQVAKRLGAGAVIGAARRPAPVPGADEVVALADAAAGAEADVVLDYLWGEPAAAAMLAVLRARGDRSRLLDWVQIGAVAGPTIELPSVALRSANLRLQGNGQGAVSAAAYVAELPSLVAEIAAGTFRFATRAVPMGDAGRVWDEPDAPGTRTVLVTGTA